MKDLVSIIQKAARNIYSVPRLGVIVNDNDPAGANRFLTQVPGLGWDTNESARWCHVSDRKSYVAPQIGDYVIVQFLDGKVDYPIITGNMNEMKDMLAKSYQHGKDVIYEHEDKIRVTFDNQTNIMEIGNSSMQYAARTNDATTSSAVEDATFWTWLAAAAAVLAGLGVVVPIPTSLTGKISGGSNQVKIGDA